MACQFAQMTPVEEEENARSPPARSSWRLALAGAAGALAVVAVGGVAVMHAKEALTARGQAATSVLEPSSLYEYGRPQYGQPQYGQPQYGQPQYGQPQYGQPQYGQPQHQQPQYQADSGLKVPCAGDDGCTCEWATGGADGLCIRVDSPRTACWGCCCSRLFPNEYQWATRNDHVGPIGPDHGVCDGVYQPGDEVVVHWAAYGFWRLFWSYATVEEAVGERHFKVDYFFCFWWSEVVDCDRLTPYDYWSCFWFWCDMLVLLCCCFGCCAFAAKQNKKLSECWEKTEKEVEDAWEGVAKDDKNRSCRSCFE